MITIYVFSDENCFPKYIGKTKELDRRIKQHLNCDRFKYKSWFYNWLNKQIKEGIGYYIDIEAANFINCRKSSLSNAINRNKTKKYRGFIWNYS